MSIDLHAFDTPNGRKLSVALEEMALAQRESSTSARGSFPEAPGKQIYVGGPKEYDA